MAGLGFHDVHELPNDADRDEIRFSFASKYPDRSEGTIASWTGQVYRFLHEIAIGDGVVTADMVNRRYIVGVVKSGPLSAPSEGSASADEALRVRKVRWDRHVRVDALPRAVRASLACALAIFEVPVRARFEILRLAGPLEEALPDAPPPEVPDLALPMPMAALAKDALADYLAAHWPQLPPMPERDAYERQRRAFLARFGPDRLAAMSEQEWLEQIPLGVESRDSMDSWLEFKSDDEFDTRAFGSIAGGSAAKLGVWLHRKTGRWRLADSAAKIRAGTEAEAIEACRERVAEALAAVQVIRSYVGTPIEDVDPLEVQRRIEEAAPVSSSRAWLHKYLSLVCPELISWSATEAFSRSQLYRVGVPAPEGLGIYAMDVLLLQFWSQMEQLADEPPDVRWRLSRHQNPRDHWVLIETDTGRQARMLRDGFVGLGPIGAGDLSGALEYGKKADVKAFVKTALADTNVKAITKTQNELAELLTGFKEGTIVALASAPEQVVAVGKVTGGYEFVPEHGLAHRKPVTWFHATPFEIPGPFAKYPRCTRVLHPDHPAVAEIEASVVAAGEFPWPGFEAMRLLPPPAAADQRQDPPGPAERSGEAISPLIVRGLPPLDEPLAGLAAALERKGQIILYGPPGTGKTYQARRLAMELIARHNFGVLPAEAGPHAKAMGGSDEQVGYLTFATFHPMYAYEDFVEGYRPDGHGNFEVQLGLLRRVAAAAHAEREKRFVLVIDEINRGNIPKIFGELITLVEVNKRDALRVHLPLSRQQFTLPSNLWIIGTMNTADRSIALLDTALRRRFALRELMPDASLLRGVSIEGLVLSDWLRSLNRRIVEALGHDGRNLQVGHAYLMHDSKPVSSVDRLRDVIRDDIWPLIQEYCYEDPRLLGVILCEGAAGIYDSEARDLRHELFVAGRELDLIDALSAVLVGSHGVVAGAYDVEDDPAVEDEGESAENELHVDESM